MEMEWGCKALCHGSTTVKGRGTQRIGLRKKPNSCASSIELHAGVVGRGGGVGRGEVSGASGGPTSLGFV